MLKKLVSRRSPLPLSILVLVGVIVLGSWGCGRCSM